MQPASMLLLAGRGLSRSYGPNVVLHHVDLTLNQGERLGLVGANGAGKSTLLRLLAGVEPPDAGQVLVPDAVDVGYLPQASPLPPDTTLDELVREVAGGLGRLEARLRHLEAAMAADAENIELIDAYGAVAQQFEARGGYDLEHRLEQVLGGLRLRHVAGDRALATLSGGERARASLAALLLRAPDVLLLDEPTNHLDAASLSWLEDYLAAHRGGMLVVSHDRHFLNRTVNGIYQVDDSQHTLQRFAGDYDAYRAELERQRARALDAYQRQQEEIADLRRAIKQGSAARQVAHHRRPRDGDKLVYNFKGENVQRAVSRTVRAAEERLARLEAQPLSPPPDALRLASRFDGVEGPRADTALRLMGVGKAFGARSVLRDVWLDLRPATRLVITGPNGTGKTTLLRLMAGIEAPDTGQVRWASGSRVGYLPQDPTPGDQDASVLEAYASGLDGGLTPSERVAELLRSGLFRYDQLAQPVGRLSLGQQRKLEIARLLALRPTLLLLDEPTNHLALDVLERFEAAVLAFPGPVVAVSHDRWFLDRFVGRRFELVDGALRPALPG